jgi:hypothetical protein
MTRILLTNTSSVIPKIMEIELFQNLSLNSPHKEKAQAILKIIERNFKRHFAKYTEPLKFKTYSGQTFEILQ